MPQVASVPICQASRSGNSGTAGLHIGRGGGAAAAAQGMGMFNCGNHGHFVHALHLLHRPSCWSANRTAIPSLSIIAIPFTVSFHA